MGDSSAPALQRGLEIIKLVASVDGCAPNVIERELGIPKASLARLIDTLLSNDTVRYRLDGGGELVLGSVLQSQVMAAYERDSLVRCVKPILRRLSEKWNATFVVYEYQRDFKLVWRVKDESLDGITTRPAGFTINALNINAQGQLFLSLLSDKEIKRFVDAGFSVGRTPETLTSYDDLLERVKRIRENGYAYQERENHRSMKQVAVRLVPRGIPGIYALGCFLPVDYPETDALIDAMLLEAGALYGAE